jgi:glycerophosphoryl diester phosphodiesterase
MTSKELCRKSVGDWFNLKHPQLACSAYNREVVPTLEQVLGLFKVQYTTDRSVIYIEIKSDNGGVENALLLSVVKLIVQHDLLTRAVVVSFDLKAITQIKTLESSVRTGALFEPRRSTTKIMSGHPLIAAAVDCGADEILLHRLIATRRLVRLAAERDLRSVVWTVDDPKWLGRAGRLGIHALITNNPAAMRLK